MSLNKRVERFSFNNRVGDIFPEGVFDFILRILLKRERSGVKFIAGFTPTQVILTESADSPEVKADIPWLWIREKKRSVDFGMKDIQKIRECSIGSFLAKHVNGEAFFGRAFLFNREEVWFRTFAGEIRTWKWREISLTPAKSVDPVVLFEPREKLLEEKIAELELEKKELTLRLSKAGLENAQLRQETVLQEPVLTPRHEAPGRFF